MFTYNVTSRGVPGSYGLDPFSGSYVQIQFEGDLSFDKLFGHLIDFDQESKSLNLFESLKKILERGNLIGFSENQWVSILLQFSQKYLPGEYSALCRFESCIDGTKLFQNIVRYLNTDTEIAKTRHRLSKITRSLKEPIHLSVRYLQNHFSRLLSLTFPTLDPEVLRTRCEFMTTRCIPHLVSPKMAELLQKHILYKTSLGTKLSVEKICSYIESQEVLQTDLKITHPLTLPGSCLYLEYELNESQIDTTLESNFTKVSRRNDQSYESNERRNRSPYRNVRKSKRNNSNPRYNSNTRDRQRKEGSFTKSSRQSPRNYSGNRGYRSNSRGRFQRNSSRENYRRKNSGGRSFRDSSRKDRGRQNSRNRSRNPSKSTNRRSSSQNSFNNRNRKSNDRNVSDSRSVSRERQGNRGKSGSQERGKQSRKGVNSDAQLKCFRCGSSNHKASKCPIYKSRSATPCRECKLDHKTSDCKTPKKRHSNHTEVQVDNPPK